MITLNLLHNSRANPTLSVYAYIFGLYDFNKSYMEPPVTRMIVQTNLATLHHGVIMAQRVGILIHHFTNIYACTDKFPQLA